MDVPFIEFPKVSRFRREIIITEKIDGTNAQLHFTDDGRMLVGSRTRWITPDADNFGFAKWAHDHEADLRKLGPGSHFGEWWGSGIQRRYGLTEKRFSLFNVSRWEAMEGRPSCCGIVPVLYRGPMVDDPIEGVLDALVRHGSVAAPGFMDPEGIVIYHTASRMLFKQTIKNDDTPKSKL